jgi:putative membrane protein
VGWLNVLVTVVAAYIIVGFAAIGNEIENPFRYEGYSRGAKDEGDN